METAVTTQLKCSPAGMQLRSAGGNTSRPLQAKTVGAFGTQLSSVKTQPFSRL